MAISFDKRFDNRWENVIKPAVNEVGLEPYRVDIRKASDSIITEIVSGIGNCSLFLADVSAFDKLNNRPIRNENVLYEVGIAHSSRLPEEVILFRSDDEYLMFDLANIRGNSYDPDGDFEEAKKVVIESLNSALKEINLQKHFSVQKAADSLTIESRKILESVGKFDDTCDGSIKREFENNKGMPYAVDRNNAYAQLIELGILCTHYSKNESDLHTDNRVKQADYDLTKFGFAVVAEVNTRLR